MLVCSTYLGQVGRVVNVVGGAKICVFLLLLRALLRECEIIAFLLCERVLRVMGIKNIPICTYKNPRSRKLQGLEKFRI